ncbi:uncharacterized protein [Ambystoma mexicanum]|uniref:uncharacterized protein n=1 Tax=Ambystoma mexicanum TaxID=8296 RepID=UPI0037E6FD9C
MASKKSEGTWANLQESLNRVREQRGLVPRARWDYLINHDARLRAHLEKQRNSKRALSSPFLPSLSDAPYNLGFHPRPGKKASLPLPVEGKWRQDRRRDSVPAFNKYHFINVYHGRTERTQDPGAIRHFFNSEEFALDFVDSFIAEALQDDLVPDVLIETLTDWFTKHEKRPPLKSPSKAQSKDKLPHLPIPDSAVIAQQQSESLLDEVVTEVLTELSIDAIRTTLKEFVDQHLMKTAAYDITEDLVLETVPLMAQQVIQEIWQDIESEEIIDAVVYETTEEEVKTLVYSVIGECDTEFSHLQKKQITTHAARQLIDMYFMEHLVDMLGVHGPVLFGKDPAVRLLDSCMLDILIYEYLNVQKQQEATLENAPIAHFHQTAFQELALDVLLTELTKMMDEDMEDLFEYERNMELGDFHD